MFSRDTRCWGPVAVTNSDFEMGACHPALMWDDAFNVPMPPESSWGSEIKVGTQCEAVYIKLHKNSPFMTLLVF